MTYYNNSGGNMTAMDNNTEHGHPEGGSTKIDPDTIPAIVLMVFILLINSCVILLISSYSYLRTTSNIILASLAVSDFLVGFVGIPLLVACSSTFLSPVCLSSDIFFTFMSLSTVLHITVMTSDRYIYIMCALRYCDIVNRGRVVAVLCVTWFISLSPLVRLLWTLHVNLLTAKEDLALVEEKETTYMLFNLTMFFLIPLIVMTVLDSHMLLLLRKQCQRIARENVPAEFIRHENKMQRRQRRAVFTCVLLLVLYVVFWLPYFTLWFIQFYFSADDHGAPHLAVLFIYYLRLCPSLVNPVAYTLRKPDLNRAVNTTMYKIFPRLRPYHLENRTEQIPLSSRTDV